MKIYSKMIASAACFGLVVAPSSVPLLAQSEQVQRGIATQDSPVNCSIFDNQTRPFPVSSTRNPRVKTAPPAAGSTPPPASAVPPPLPPPPSAQSAPPPAEAAAESVVVTGVRKSGNPASGPIPIKVLTEDEIRNSGHIIGVHDITTLTFPKHRYPRPIPVPPRENEKYDGEEVASIKRVADAPVSTFSVDVDTGSYSNVRRFLRDGQLPPKAAVRSEEMINYFRYDYPLPKDRKTPFSVTTDMAQTPWNKDTQLLRIGLRGYDIDRKERPSANLVFLVDVSGSMRSKNKLPLVKQTLLTLSRQLRDDDRVSIVVYSGKVGTLLKPTSNKVHIAEAVSCMVARGSTAGGDALKMAYTVARSNYDKAAINRIIMTTDGDFNVGTTNTDQLKDIVAKERESGVTLTMLGYGQGNYNESIMEGIANVGNGNYAYIDSALEAQKVMTEELSSTLFTIAKDVKLQLEFNPAYVSQYRLIGYENRVLAEEDFDNDKVDAGDIGASHQVTALYEIVPAGGKGWAPQRRYQANEGGVKLAHNGEMGFLKLRYKLPSSDTSKLIEYPLSADEMKGVRAPSGDMAFAVAVGAFGQKLRGDKYLGNYSYNQISALAGKQDIFWRSEFVKLVSSVEGVSAAN